MSDQLKLTREVARVYGRKGGATRAAVFRMNIEGRYFNTAEASRHLGISESTARRRIKRIMSSGATLTMDAIAGRDSQ